MICNYIDAQRFRFLWFSQNLIKTPLTEIKCLRIVYAKFENKQLYINVFQWLFAFAFTLSKALLLKKSIFEIKPSDYSLVRPRKSIQTTLCLRKIFHNVIFVVLGEDFSTWLILSGCSFSLTSWLDWMYEFIVFARTQLFFIHQRLKYIEFP